MEPEIQEYYGSLPEKPNAVIKTGLQGWEGATDLEIYFQDRCTIIVTVGEVENASPYIYKGIQSVPDILRWYKAAMVQP